MEASITTPPTPKTKEELQEIEQSLPKELWFNSYPMYFYQGFWNIILESTISCQNHFEAQDTDIFIASIPKTGTTWLKSLLFSLFNRTNHPPNSQFHPLLSHNPHELIPQLESIIYANPKNPDLKSIKPTQNTDSASDYCRVLGTHLPHQSLPESMRSSNCKIVYIVRHPLDTFISSWLFYLNYDGNESVKGYMIEEYFGKFCEGKFPFGPFEDHVLGYWKQSLEKPEKVLYVKFEDLKADFEGELKRLARFVGCPFSEEEERRGVIDEIMKLCSIERLKEIEANKSGRVYSFIQNKWFFRKGEVGDWVNYLSPDTVESFVRIMEEKFGEYGFKL